MSVPFTLPTPKHMTEKPVADARDQLEHLYREIGISAVASALHMQGLATVEERAQAALSSHDLPAILRKDVAA